MVFLRKHINTLLREPIMNKRTAIKSLSGPGGEHQMQRMPEGTVMKDRCSEKQV